MKPYYQDNDATIFNGNFLDNDLPDESVQMVVTSPPYWGLRKYDGEQELIWGGDKDCQHEWQPLANNRGNGDGRSFRRDKKAGIARGTIPDNACSLCGAWRGAYGLEPTPEMYVQHTVEILREIRRVLRKDGVVFWNIGDSYAGSWGNSGSRGGVQRTRNQDRLDRKAWDNNTERPASSRPQGSIKPKELCLIP